MKKTLILLLLSTSLFAQDRTTDLFNVNVIFLGIGIQYEKSLAKNFTAVGSLEYVAGLSYSEDWNGEGDFKYILTTNLSLEGRYYYNLDRRVSKGKKYQ